MRHGRRDSCHAPIRNALRACGLQVHDIGDVGKNLPDLMTARHGVTYLMECKDPKTGKATFTREQVESDEERSMDDFEDVSGDYR